MSCRRQVEVRLARIAAVRVAHEERIFAIEHDPLHLAFTDVMPTPRLCRANNDRKLGRNALEHSGAA